MKKLITITIAMMLLLTACGTGAQQTNDNGSKKLFASKSIEGIWYNDDEIQYPGEGVRITIDGDDVLIENFGHSFVGTVDRDAETITVKDAQKDDNYKVIGDAVFKYQLIGDKLVLTADNDKTELGYDSTFSYTRQEVAEAEGSEK